MKEYTTKVDSLSEKESIRSEEEQSASETKPIVFGKSDLKYGGGGKGWEDLRRNDVWEMGWKNEWLERGNKGWMDRWME